MTDASQSGAQSSQPPVDLAPDWWQTGVVYQIYPRSFADTSGDGIGDLAGIADHLDHLGGAADSLPVDAIWLSPIYPSPDFDFGYDVADYLGVDPRFGTLADFERLTAAAHRRGIRIILDLVLNHSSSRHAWFQASRATRDGPYADWYIWRDSPGRSLFGGRRPPNNWRSFFGGSAWTWDEARQQFYLHTFLPEQPDLNWRNPAVRAALLDVVRTWLERGVDGFRLDVFNTFYKDEALRNNPLRFGGRGAWSWQRHVHDRNQLELAGALADIRSLVNEQPGRMTVGELFDGTIVDAAAYIEPRHLIFDWTFINLPWSAAAFRSAIKARDAAFGSERWPANVLSNHDQPRHVSRFSESGANGDAIAKVAAAMLLTLRGTPFLYYGEEIALRNLDIPNDRALDPPARRASWLFPWWNRDQARGPMPWRPGSGAGFTSGTPWLPLPPDADTRNVERQAADPGSVLAWYRSVLALRGATPALQRGSQVLLDPGPANVLAYRRELDGTFVLVALNFGGTEATIEAPVPPEGRTWRSMLSTHPRSDGAPLATTVTLAPFEALVASAR
ncbi:MAG TPA: alpha-glucosidase [Candidatus Limnocylindrales bacterium]|nr:alpha-glucosidase [Candidatus Limnocylindrales bacterium]